jgi:hypothetical protein
MECQQMGVGNGSTRLCHTQPVALDSKNTKRSLGTLDQHEDFSSVTKHRFAVPFAQIITESRGQETENPFGDGKVNYAA